MIQIAFADTAEVLIVRTGDVVGEGRRCESKTRLQRSDVIPFDAPGGRLGLSSADRNQEGGETTPNDPTIQRSKGSRSTGLGAKRSDQLAGASSTRTVRTTLVGSLDRWIVGS